MNAILERPLSIAPENRTFLKTRRVLLVEDSADIRNMLRFMLQSTGVQVNAVGNGKNALDLIGSSPAPDAIILDRMLPMLSGDELVKLIRCAPTWSDTPIVVISARSGTEEIASIVEMGADDYITKPFAVSQVLRIVNKYLPY